MLDMFVQYKNSDTRRKLRSRKKEFENQRILFGNIRNILRNYKRRSHQPSSRRWLVVDIRRVAFFATLHKFHIHNNILHIFQMWYPHSIDMQEGIVGQNLLLHNSNIKKFHQHD
jgi:hypothetical protein